MYIQYKFFSFVFTNSCVNASSYCLYIEQWPIRLSYVFTLHMNDGEDILHFIILALSRRKFFCVDMRIYTKCFQGSHYDWPKHVYAQSSHIALISGVYNGVRVRGVLVWELTIYIYACFRVLAIIFVLAWLPDFALRYAIRHKQILLYRPTHQQ